jgi:hypothetical protein
MGDIVPQRLRYFLLHNSDLTNRVIRIAVGLIEHQLIQNARAPDKTVAAKARQTAQGVSASLWAMLLARIYEVFPLICPYCGSELRILAFVTDSSSISTILSQLGLPAQPPRIAHARAPPWEMPAEDFNQEFSDPEALSQEPPEFEYDQRINW